MQYCFNSTMYKKQRSYVDSGERILAYRCRGRGISIVKQITIHSQFQEVYVSDIILLIYVIRHTIASIKSLYLLCWSYLFYGKKNISRGWMNRNVVKCGNQHQCIPVYNSPLTRHCIALTIKPSLIWFIFG